MLIEHAQELSFLKFELSAGDIDAEHVEDEDEFLFAIKRTFNF